MPQISRELRGVLEASHPDGKLVLSGRGMEVIPEQVFQLQTLTSLDLSSNVLFDLPKDISRLENLTTLDLKWNRVSDMHRSIGQLKQLTLLDLGFNELTFLPAELGELRSLRTLLLNDNSLLDVPKELGQLTDLRVIDLQHNQLQMLPLELCQLTNLDTLQLSGNPLESPPPPVVLGGVSSVLNHLQSLYRLQQSSSIPASPGRVVVAGVATGLDEEHILEDTDYTPSTAMLGLPPKVPANRASTSMSNKPGTSGARPFTPGVGTASRPSTSQIGNRVVVNIGAYKINAEDEEDAARLHISPEPSHHRVRRNHPRDRLTTPARHATSGTIEFDAAPSVRDRLTNTVHKLNNSTRI
eukprot:2067781-Pyramimonas_sp.AAC.2